MADFEQSGSTDISVSMASGARAIAPFPICSSGGTEKTQTVGYAPPIIYGNDLYVCIQQDWSDNSYYSCQRIRKLDLTAIDARWVNVSDTFYSQWNGYQATFTGIGVSSDKIKFWLVGIYCDNLSGGKNKFGYTAVNDLTSPGWNSNPITDRSDSGEEQGRSSYVIDDGTNIVYTGFCDSNSYYKNGVRKIPKSNLTGSWGTASNAPFYFGRGSYVVYGGEIYFFGGSKASSSTNSDSASSEVAKYNSITDIWTRYVIPNPPFVNWHQGTTCLVGTKVYIVQKDNAAHHYYDLAQGAAGTWQECPYPNSTANSYSALAYDGVRQRLVFVDATSGAVEFLPLKPDCTPAAGTWTTSGSNIGTTNIAQNPLIEYPDCPFVIDTQCRDITGNGFDFTFTIETSGYRISSHTSTYISPTAFTVQSTATGYGGLAETETPDISFPILFSGLDNPPENVSVSFNIQSAAEGTALTHQGQTGTTVDIPVVVTTYGQAATGVIGTASILAIDKWYFGGAIAATNIIGMGECDVTVDVGMLYESQNGAIGATGSGAATVLFSLARAFGAMSESHGGAVIVPPATVDGWTVNLATGGHTQFTNWQFNSLFELNGQRYACNDTGLFRLTGNRDGDAVIDGCVISGVTDFGTMKLKYINSAYVHLRTDGDVAFRMVADEQRNRSGYHISFDGRQGIHRRRRKLAKGIKGTVWQAEMRNVDGADMEVAKVELLLAKSKRAIG